MQAVILAAGKGSRLGKVTTNIPKPMVKVGEASIIHHQIQSCMEAGISEFVIVTGYYREKLEAHIQELLPAEQVNFVRNCDYASTNTLYSLYLASEYLYDDTLYLNADVMFEPRLLSRLLDYEGSSLLVEYKANCVPEEVKVITDKEQMLMAIGKELELSACDGEFMGIACFRKELLEMLQMYLAQGIRNQEHNNFFEHAVNQFCHLLKIKCISTSGQRCLEIDYPEDLERSREMFS